MAYSLDDRHRSMRRFLMNAVGSPPWLVRTERIPVPDEQRPVAVVEVAAPAITTRWRTSIPQGNVEKAQTFSLTLYPAMVDDEGAPLTAAAARLGAHEAAELLDAALTFGLAFDDGSVLSPPRMIAIYDFEGVPVEGPGRAGAVEPYGWLTVDDAPVSVIPDPDDHLRWTVACDVRVSWSQPGRVGEADPLVGSMPGVFDATP